MTVNLKAALELARERFSRLDPAGMAGRGGADWNSKEGRISLKTLGETCSISYPSGQVLVAGKTASDTFSILVLHYLAYTHGIPPGNRWISFKEIPGAVIYSAPFQQRCVAPLLKYFASQPGVLTAVAGLMQGEPGKLGDISVLLCPLPRVPICYVMWSGDEEFPPSGTVLFDASVIEHLPIEDCVQLTSYVLNRLIAARVEIDG